MKEFITLETDFGDIKVEVSESSTVYRGDKESNFMKTKIHEVEKIIHIFGNSISESSKKIINKPSEVEFQFGLKFSGEAGVVIAKTTLVIQPPINRTKSPKGYKILRVCCTLAKRECQR